ncbi:stage II sporulation protein M [Novipirellula artificiosorum]|uniref:Stage II sporulation protein M n=1 Tax=Novipirellula artificiosorum TaxID=2528016 RepID=A0A5C6DYE9_9BACT|nr:stage II sporulation protein M [Novipirellula artificiosorum]TWU40431.1 hypothetical protein Poly41_12630 [Novipirellula artificiosorum]
MNVASLLEKRRVQWTELESLCDAMESRGRTEKAGGAHHRGAEGVARFSTLYRAACADLALADAYQLPPNTVTYLHQLVARAHNQLYRARKFEPTRWIDTIFHDAPQQIFADPCVRAATLIFFGLFTLSMFLGYNEERFPGFAQSMVGATALEQIEDMYEKPISKSLDHYIQMAGFYIKHNTGIGLQCFAFGILIIPCVFILAYNAISLGTMFGYMARPDVVGGDNFFHFVTAHGPFELTAIALSAAAGLRLGLGLFCTGGLTRYDSVRQSAAKAVPVMGASVVLFVLAAITEGFLSPSPAPYVFKALWAIMSSGLISFYFVVLGFPSSQAPSDYFRKQRGGVADAA